MKSTEGATTRGGNKGWQSESCVVVSSTPVVIQKLDFARGERGWRDCGCSVLGRGGRLIAVGDGGHEFGENGSDFVLRAPPLARIRAWKSNLEHILVTM
ncbi:unnamed protein product [Linum trigynum]|uniref:Uncharacterized protein n=1 Tax=Linum trigynum TaxID=586398 RepID=A0AAV2DD53_9ROSI